MKEVCLFGGADINDESFIRKLQGKYPLVACDKGYEHLLNAKVEADLLVGDYDTLDTKKIKHPKEQITLSVIKDDSDSFYIVKDLLRRGYDTFYLFGCLGGKIDHTIANIQILSYLEDHQAKGYLYSEDLKTVLFMLSSHEEVTFRKKSQGMLSVFSYTPKSTDVSEENLMYAPKHTTLTSDIAIGLSNQFLPDADLEGRITLGEGRLIVVAPTDSLESADILHAI